MSGRAAALKFLRGADPVRVMRLLQEAWAQARLDHSNVCKVYEVGEAEGLPYIAMDLVRGQRLDERRPRWACRRECGRCARWQGRSTRRTGSA